MAEKKKTRKKITTEKGTIPTEIKEDKAIKVYTSEHYFKAIQDLSIEVNNAYFRLPFIRCPQCKDISNNRVLAYFGLGKSNAIGNLKGFNATTGDYISWYSDTYKGVSKIVKKSNGVFELDSVTFDIPRKEPAIVEKLVIPEKYLPILEEMATFLAYPFVDEDEELAKIGEGGYPNDIKAKL